LKEKNIKTDKVIIITNVIQYNEHITALEFGELYQSLIDGNKNQLYKFTTL